VAACFPARDYRLEPTWRYVKLYDFYLQDAQLGRCLVRLGPYCPCDAPLGRNGHAGRAQPLRAEGIGFRKHDNAFRACDNPSRLQERADAFGPEHLAAAVEPWLARWLPYRSAAERAPGYRHQLFVAQAAYCHNAVCHRVAALDRLFSRLLDPHRALGHPDQRAVICGRPPFRPDPRTGPTAVKVRQLKTTVITTSFGGTSLTQYVQDRALLRTETRCFQLRARSVPKDVRNLPKLRAVLSRSTERYPEAQPDVRASAVDRGPLERLRPPTGSAAGRRTPGLRRDDARLVAVRGALTSFAYLRGKACCRTADRLEEVRRARDNPG
jgi:hypothetical protein